MTASFGATIALAVWRDLGGLPALPLLSLAFLLANADLLWREIRRSLRRNDAAERRHDVLRVRRNDAAPPRAVDPVELHGSSAAAMRSTSRAGSGISIGYEYMKLTQRPPGSTWTMSPESSASPSGQ